jgi:hypothetical protein
MLKAYSKVEFQDKAEVFATACIMVNTALERFTPPTELGGAAGGSSGSCECTAALPWLMLLGRCCYDCAVGVGHWRAVLESNGATYDNIFQGMGVLVNVQLLHGSLSSVAQWLAAEGSGQQLGALGYDSVGMQQGLAAATQALQSNALQVANLTAGTPTFALLKDIQQLLQAAGSVLADFAIPHACNNPACSNLCGASEAQLVGGRSCICAGCLTARYCGRACQRAVWRQHKPVCKALAAAAAAAAAAVPSR